ncbi:MAG: matrixin family metalloprotease [Planctomycetota bacterium]
MTSKRNHPLLLCLLSVAALGCAFGQEAPATRPATRPSTRPATANTRPAPLPPVVEIRGRWQRPTPIALRYFVSPEQLPEPTRSGVTPESYDAALEGALAQWTNTGVVTFTKVATATEADFSISWESETHASCSRLLRWEGQRAHAGPVAPGTFIHLNRDIGWRPRPRPDGAAPGDPLLSTLLHEVGHVLGLGHSTEADGVMNGAFNAEHTQLTDLDRGALHSLYGGGRNAASDVTIYDVDSNGRWVQRGHRLRRVAPAVLQTQLIDLDGDGVAELLTWPREWTPGTGIMIYRFDKDGFLTTTVGPVLGLLSPGLDLQFVTASDGKGIALHRLPERRYHAFSFDERLLAYPWPHGKALSLTDGSTDQDGDGCFEAVAQARPTSPKNGSWTLLYESVDGRAKLMRRPLMRDQSSGRWLYRWTAQGAAVVRGFGARSVFITESAGGRVSVAVTGAWNEPRPKVDTDDDGC